MSKHASARHAAHHKKTNIAKQVILLGLSFILMTAAIVFISIFAVNKLYITVANSEIGLLFGSDPDKEYYEADTEDTGNERIVPLDIDEGGILDESKFPKLAWGDLWSYLTIPGYERAENVPVFVGDSNDILSKGVGKYYGSVYPGEIGNIVLSAHVNRWFYDIEDLPIGQQIILDTSWGQYVYEVESTAIFDADDPDFLNENDGTEKLICYTCYPRGIAFRAQRYAVICKKVSGGEWK